MYLSVVLISLHYAIIVLKFSEWFHLVCVYELIEKGNGPCDAKNTGFTLTQLSPCHLRYFKSLQFIMHQAICFFWKQITQKFAKYEKEKGVQGGLNLGQSGGKE